jgi:single-strand DNA-binding protein
MRSINTVTISGNLGQDPDVRFFESGNCLAKFSIAVSERVKGEDVTNWINIEVWGKLASEIVAEYCKKGSKIAVTGRLKVNSWEDKASGAKRNQVVVTANEIVLLGDKQGAGDTAREREPARTKSKPDYDDMPF